MTSATTPDARDFRLTMGRMAKCVSVTTAMTPAGPIGCTTTGVLSLSTDPASILVSLTTSGRTLADALAAGSFSVNVLSTRQQDLIHQFASGDPGRRFDGVRYRLRGGAPVLADASASVVCRVRDAIQVLDHTLLIGDVQHAHTSAWPPLLLLDGMPCAAVAGLDTAVSQVVS